MVYANYHTHTTFCDGRSTPAEMVQAALAAGCPAIGFSAHGYVPFDGSYCLQPADTQSYRAEISRLREQHRDRITVLCGLEQDILSVPPDAAYDYCIGAVHYVPSGETYTAVDIKADDQIRVVRECYGGDWYAFTAAYYAEVATLPQRVACDLIAHFDLITKFNEGGRLFDENNRRYRHAALEALDAVCAAGVPFEINTGAIRRGYRTAPYPAPFLLRALAQRQVPVLLSADAHDAKGLLFHFDEAHALATAYGLTVLPAIPAKE